MTTIIYINAFCQPETTAPAIVLIKTINMEKHDLLHEFPEYREKIHELKTSNQHFRKLFDEYHEVDHDIHRIEHCAEATTDEVLNGLRIKRVQLKDNLYKQLQGL